MRRKYSIWDEMRRIQEEMDSMFNSFFATEPILGNPLLEDNSSKNKELITSNYKAPASDFYETDKEVVLEVDMPGVDKKDIEVNVTEDAIEIKAEKKNEIKEEDKKKGMFRLERSFAGFYRSFSIPSDVDPEKANAKYKDGVLKISIPKLEIKDRKKKLIEIK